MKMNKKGFTLAELLIVIAIIAILIAIAIPVFAGQLKNAQLQTDHANIRSAYAMVQVANLEGGIFLGDGDEMTTNEEAKDTIYYFNADGTISENGTPYILKADGDDKDCAPSAGCQGQTHAAGAKIKITCDGTKWELTLEK